MRRLALLLLALLPTAPSVAEPRAAVPARAVASVPAAVPSAAASPLVLDAWLAAIAKPAPATTPYVELRWSRLLATPVVSAGSLEYLGPGRLAKRVDAPFRETTTIDGDRVEILREGQPPRRFSLARVPELRVLLGTFGALLGGDRATLERAFVVVLAERADGWTATLTPREPRLAQRVRAIEVHGRAPEPDCLALREANGNLSWLLFGALARESWTPAVERAAVERRCGVPGG